MAFLLRLVTHCLAMPFKNYLLIGTGILLIIQYGFWYQLILRVSSTSGTKPIDDSFQQQGRRQKQQFTSFKDDTRPDDTPYAIFYNVYIPPDTGQDRVDKALGIIQEQIQQVRQSYAANKYNGEKIVPLYYNTIGDENALTVTAMDKLCTGNHASAGNSTLIPSLHCQHMQHYKQGHEHVTLQRLYEYCQEFPDNKVIYIHPKGSFHQYADNKNDRWRQRLTDAATHEQCLDTPPNDSCDVCSLHFYPMWAPFFPGNLWTAKCSYIKKLLPPHNYSQVMDDVADYMLELRDKNQLLFSFYNISEEDKLCRGRYSAECWVGSHPDLVPCEVADNPNVWVWMHASKANAPFHFQMSPQAGIHASWFLLNQPTVKEVLRNTDLRQREYFMLPGNIIKWNMLYNKLPEKSSWVWKWFPDSSFWQSSINKHKTNAVEYVTSQIATKHKSRTKRKYA